jgi:hypothetical protein
MEFPLLKIKDERLKSIAGSIPADNADNFSKIKSEFPEYDPSFLWMITYLHEDAPALQNYIATNFQKFHQVLDAKFLKKLAKLGGFESHLWEMILCDLLSASGTLIPKSESGSDFLLRGFNSDIQFEAVAPDEAEDSSLRSERPVYDATGFFSGGGFIHDQERPVLLRAIKGFDQKESKYNPDRPLVIAINTSKVVGTISQDNYVLRMFLFGLGNLTLTELNDGSYRKGFEQLGYVNKPGQPPFQVGYFRNPAYSHVSGVIYTSQSARGLTPGGWGWSNSGVTCVPNPLAKHPIDISFPFFHRLECKEGLYQEIPAETEFISTL